ncbi:MAG TPA: hypothetical protein PKW59_12260 [Thermotogota bacterium]|nr:hypothetical protein [Thermotogota bacterium]
MKRYYVAFVLLMLIFLGACIAATIEPVWGMSLTETDSGVVIRWKYGKGESYDYFLVGRREHGSTSFKLMGKIPFTNGVTDFSYEDRTAGGDNIYEYGISVVKGNLESSLARKRIQTEYDLVEFNTKKNTEALHILSEGGFVRVNEYDGESYPIDKSGDTLHWGKRLPNRGDQVLVWCDNAGNPIKPMILSDNVYIKVIDEFSNGDLIMVGEKYISSSKADLYIARISRDGETTVWEKTYGGATNNPAFSVDLLPDGGFVVAGFNPDDINRLRDFWVLRLNSSGNIVWKKCYGGSDVDQAYSVKALPDGGFVVAGWTQSKDGDVSGNHGGSDYWVIRLNANGNLVWQRCLGGNAYDYAYDILPTSDGGFIVTGAAESYSGSSGSGNISAPKGNVSMTQRDVWVAKLNAEGRILWEKSYGGSNSEYGRKIIPLENDRYMIAGGTESSDKDVGYYHSNSDAWVFVIDTNGKLLWERCFEPSAINNIHIGQLSDGKFLLAGDDSLVKFSLNLE